MLVEEFEFKSVAFQSTKVSPLPYHLLPLLLCYVDC